MRLWPGTAALLPAMSADYIPCLAEQRKRGDDCALGGSELAPRNQRYQRVCLGPAFAMCHVSYSQSYTIVPVHFFCSFCALVLA